MMLNPENQQLQSFQNSQQSPLGSLQGSREKYAQVTNFTLIKNRPWGRGANALTTKTHCARLHLEDP